MKYYRLLHIFHCTQNLSYFFPSDSCFLISAGIHTVSARENINFPTLDALIIQNPKEWWHVSMLGNKKQIFAIPTDFHLN